MSVFGMMRTSIAGMSAQSERLGAISDNIANAKTSGYKRSDVDFSTLVMESGVSYYQPGSVETRVRRAISVQGGLEYTGAATDLAVKGAGFFMVQGPDGGQYLTRAGSFLPDNDGRLLNAAGFVLLGYAAEAGSGHAATLPAGGELVPIVARSTKLVATPTTQGELTVNLPAAASVVGPGLRPSDNSGSSTFTAKASLIARGTLGQAIPLDVYYAKTADNEWEMTIFDGGTATSGGFPYSGGPITNVALSFDGSTGELLSAGTLSFAVPGGATMELSLADTTQLAAQFQVGKSYVNGQPVAMAEGIEVGENGGVYTVFSDGNRVLTHYLPLAVVASPDRLTALSGNVYRVSSSSGPVQLGLPTEAGRGQIVSGALEQSNVDMARELTSLIETQRVYTANSKVFQAGAEMSDVLVNLIR